MTDKRFAMLLAHCEMTKDEEDIHPQTGDVNPSKIIDLYVFNHRPDHVLVWGYGWNKWHKQSIENVTKEYLALGYEITT